MSSCDHDVTTGTTMYVGKIWYCQCGQKMKCTGWGKHKEVKQ